MLIRGEVCTEEESCSVGNSQNWTYIYAGEAYKHRVVIYTSNGN